MRVGVATVQVPFIRGGAEEHAAGLCHALRAAGHEAEVITRPFRFAPVDAVRQSMAEWAGDDFHAMNGYEMDRVVCLKFPAYYLRHDRKVVWLLHQHREVYDLWESDGGREPRASADDRRLREEVTALDSRVLAECRVLRANSRTVADRLWRYNGVRAEPLYHPPPLADRLYSAQAEPYVFYPSRLEGLKRQDLLVRAMALVKTPVVAFIAGEGGQRAALERLIAETDTGHKVRLLGRIPDAEMLSYYAHAAGVFFGPRDEDYGYVTLEAMLAAKPVVTCTDSGGPLEFVEDGVTGRVVPPDPAHIADAIDDLYRHPRRAADIGQAGLARYRGLGVSWGRVLAELLA